MNQEYDVEKVLDKRIRNHQVKFNIRFYFNLNNIFFKCENTRLQAIFFRYLKINYVFQYLNLFFFQIEFLIKWVGFSHSENSWEPLANLNCNDILDQFEKENAKRIICAQRDANGISYLVEEKRGNFAALVGSEKAKQLWPKLVLQFLLERLTWVSEEQATDSPVESIDTVGEPIAISCKFSTRETI